MNCGNAYKEKLIVIISLMIFGKQRFILLKMRAIRKQKMQMLILYYKFENDEYEYLNFMVKLTIGIKTNNKHVQYSVNSIDIK